MSEEKEKVESVRAAFAGAFAPYTDLKLDGLSLEDVEAKLREVGELKVRHTGKVCDSRNHENHRPHARGRSRSFRAIGGSLSKRK